jgi:hypothetical protein
MLTIEGIFDGRKIEPLSKIPFKDRKKVLITFLNDKPHEASSNLDPIKALKGCAKGINLTSKLLESRNKTASPAV